MKTRNWAYWHGVIAACIALPLLLTTMTGMLLILRKELTFIQPKASKVKPIQLGQELPLKQIVSQLPQKKWSSLILKPAKGIYQLRSTDGYEYHINAVNGAFLNEGPKRTGFFIRLHEGSYFGEGVRKYIFFPAAIGLLFLWVSGVFLFFKITLKRLKYKREDSIEKISGDIYGRI